jgi:hypothetical protein
MKNFGVYCIREQRLSEDESIHYKIGCAQWPHKRIRQLQPGNPHKLRPVFYIEGFKSKREAEKVEQAFMLCSTNSGLGMSVSGSA